MRGCPHKSGTLKIGYVGQKISCVRIREGRCRIVDAAVIQALNNPAEFNGVPAASERDILLGLYRGASNLIVFAALRIDSIDFNLVQAEGVQLVEAY